MDRRTICAKARSLPGSNALYGSNTVSNEQGPLHRRPDVVKNEQGFPHGYGRVGVKKLVRMKRIRFGTWNIGTLTGKSMEIMDTMVRRKINFMCLQETKWAGQKARELDNSGFKIWYTGKVNSKNGVGIMVDKYWRSNIVGVRRIGDRIISLKFIVEQDTFNVISAYAPQVGLEEHQKIQFWEDLDGLLQEIPQGEKIFLGGDLNGHVGKDAKEYLGFHGGYGIGESNEEGKAILDFALAFDLTIANTCFKKREEHLITYKSGRSNSQIDFFLVRRIDRKLCMDCKVIPGESLTTQHRVLVLDVRIKIKVRKNNQSKIPRIKWWRLKEGKQMEFQRSIVREDCWETRGNANDMWVAMARGIRKVAENTLGISRGFGPKERESWWWDTSIQDKVKAKRECFKTWQSDKIEGNWEKYRAAKKETKKVVNEARTKAFERLYHSLGTKDGEKQIYRLAKGRERKTRDLDQVRCIKDEEGIVLASEQDIKERWKGYFHSLFNEGHASFRASDILETKEEELNLTYYRRIREFEIREALKKMKNDKAVGPDNIPIEVWKCLGEKGIRWLTKLFNEIMRSKRMPEEWRKSTLVPIFKNKGDIQSCANYRGIKLMSHTMKLWERVIEQRLRQETRISENQFGFMPGRSTMEAIYLLRSLMERHRRKQQDLHMVFIDLEKAYDRVPREVMWKALEKKGVRVAYIKAIQDMYNEAQTCVRTYSGVTDFFPITIGLHQGSALSPYLFTLVLDVLTEHIQDPVPECMLFADDIVLVEKSKTGLNEKLELWREALESQGLRVSRSKTEYMECKFSKKRENDMEVRLGDHILQKVERFKYLGSIIQNNGEIEGDVNHRIQAGWMRWRKASGVICDRKVPLKLKGKFYRSAIRPALLYGTECWAVKCQHEHKMSVAEMRMLRWMSGHTRADRIKNERIREKVGVAPIVEKMTESRLRWFGHVRRRPIAAPVRRVDQMEMTPIKRSRGRPKKTLKDTVQKDLELNGLIENMVWDRAQWRRLIHVADPT